jgi:TRAP-type transport system periplasmic protein
LGIFEEISIQSKEEDIMKKCGWLVLVGFFVLFCSLLLSSLSHAQDKVIKLKYASFLPPSHKINVLAQQWCSEVEKRTNGRVKITFFPGGILVPAPQAYEAVVKDLADISLAAPSWNAGRFPLSEVLELPLGFKDPKQATVLANAFFKDLRPKEYDDVKMIYMWLNGPGVFMTLKPLQSIKDLKGLRIRAGGNQSGIASAMGAVPVSVPNQDIYEGLQRGVIDGMLFYPESLAGWKYGDLIRGLQDNPGAGFAGLAIVVMNKQKWASLPADIQRIVDQITEEWIEKLAQTAADLDKEGRDYGLRKGMKVFMVSPDEARESAEKMKPLLVQYVKDMKEKGLPGEAALKFCQDWLKAHP